MAGGADSLLHLAFVCGVLGQRLGAERVCPKEFLTRKQPGKIGHPKRCLELCKALLEKPYRGRWTCCNVFGEMDFNRFNNFVNRCRSWESAALYRESITLQRPSARRSMEEPRASSTCQKPKEKANSR